MKYMWNIAVSAMMISSEVCTDNEKTFGKTHFIVGMPPEEYKQYQDTPGDVANAQPAQHKILFSPDDDIHSELLRLIREETESIKFAMYLFTDKDVAQALREAQLRGVCVECVTDASCIANKSNKMDELALYDIPVWVYRASNDAKTLGNAMHHKFIVFGSKKNPACKVVTGSLNITNSAQKSNQENIVVLCDKGSVEKYGTQFERLKERCSRLVPQKNATQTK